jgi:hypothetical protein
MGQRSGRHAGRRKWIYFRDSSRGESIFGTGIKDTQSISGQELHVLQEALAWSMIVEKGEREASEGLAPIVMVVEGNNEVRGHT